MIVALEKIQQSFPGRWLHGLKLGLNPEDLNNINLAQDNRRYYALDSWFLAVSRFHYISPVEESTCRSLSIASVEYIANIMVIQR
ncbi:hypothetical protein RRG08_022345 [Elysia crispata]|uniref:Uncharacterized protein n=1 Tax=Elysia crispata TaxID=231223 RepID=A0AAE1D896_9GAST|nr:hypothetical protein RRG08_022345 [Elysia crispata]